MTRALLWKEWREQRAIAAAGLALGLLLPLIIFPVAFSSTEDVHVTEVSDAIPFLLAMLVWPLVAALAGASTNAGEAASGTLGFLLSRPIGRGRLWLIKMATASATLGIVVVASFANAWLLDWSVGGHGFQFPFSSAPINAPLLPLAAVQVTALMLPLLALACALLFATLCKRQLTTALAGGATALLFVIVGIGWQGLITAAPSLSYGGDRFLLVYFTLAAAALFVAAFFAFSRAAMLRRAERWRTGLTAFVAVTVVVLGGAQAITALTTHDDASRGWLQFAANVPGKDAIILRSQPDRFTGDSLWLAATGQPLRQLTDRMAYRPVVSPDGEWLVYQSQLGPFGIRMNGCELRAVRLAGTDDHRVAEAPSCGAAMVFSNDGDRFAMAAWPAPGLRIAALDGSVPPEVLEAPPEYGYPVTWTGDDRAVVWRRPRGAAALSRIDVRSGRVSDLFVAAGATDFNVRSVSARRLLVEARFARVTGSGERVTTERSIIDLDNGRVAPAPPACSPQDSVFALIDDGTYLAYPHCTNRAPHTELRLLDLDGGAERTLAFVEGRIARVVASPTGKNLWLRVEAGADDADGSRFRDLIVDRDGDPRQLGFPRFTGRLGDWDIDRWLDDDHLLLGRYVGQRRFDYAKLHVRTDELTTIVGGR